MSWIYYAFLEKSVTDLPNLSISDTILPSLTINDNIVEIGGAGGRHLAYIDKNYNFNKITGIDIYVDENLKRAAANIMNLDVLSHHGLNVYDVVKKDNLIIIDDALKFVEESLS